MWQSHEGDIMNISKINALKVGEINKVQGFVENIRDKKSMAFWS